MSQKVIRRLTDSVIAILITFVVFTAFYSAKSMPISSKSTYCAVYNGNKEKNQVSLLFTVYNGCDNSSVTSIADCLNEKGVKATFFVSGSWADDNKDKILYLLDKNQELGNYGFYNRDFKTLNEKSTREEIGVNHELIKSMTGQEMKLFMPPNASFSSLTLKVAEKYGYTTVLWTIDTLGENYNSTSVFKRATSNVKSGDFVLLNCSQAVSNSLDKIIEYYNNVGLNVKSVSESLIKD